MTYDVLIAGGGIAGLTAAAYLSKAGFTVLVCEKEKKTGGLVNSFVHKGFTFDGGIRAIENSGIVMPMLRQLGLEIDFVKNKVSIGIENELINLVSDESLLDYRDLLKHQFPQNTEDVDRIIADIKRIMGYMDVLYGIDNPLFMDMKKDREYLAKTVLPWLFKYIFTISKIEKLNTPIEEYLRQFTDNQVLIDMIAQHFFKKTPAFFALSYFSLYLDYQYPKGGTGTLTGKLEEFIRSHGGEISPSTEICGVDPEKRQLTDTGGRKFYYKKLIWASDLRKLYQLIDVDTITDEKTKKRILKQKQDVADKIGGDSIFTAFMTVDLDKSFFEKICGAHLFYTPEKIGLFHADINTIKNKSGGLQEYTTEKQKIIDWMMDYYKMTTYEIAFPVMRDASLAPEGKTGMIISTLFEHSLVRHIAAMGWYEEFKAISIEAIAARLDSTVFPGFKSRIIDSFASTPLTLEKLTGNSDGAITGWAFTNRFIPVVHSMQKVAKSVLTPIPDVLQAGQWSFSPSGLPISILTAKLASDRAIKELK
jgi:phytoene dehydrogenase-like protein